MPPTERRDPPSKSSKKGSSKTSKTPKKTLEVPSRKSKPSEAPLEESLEAPKRVASERKLNRADRYVRLVGSRTSLDLDLGFGVRDFVLCGLPYKPQKSLVYTRRNGAFVLKVKGDPEFGLPYGQDRLFPLWLATAFQAVGMPKNNIIRFRSAADVLRAFHIPVDGRERDLLRGRIQRLFGATYFASYQGDKDHYREHRYQLMKRVDLWFHHDEAMNQYSAWHNEIELDPGFADDLRKLSVPLDMNSVRVLKETPAALDLYLWQAWRSYRLTKEKNPRTVEMSVFGPYGLLAQMGSETENRRKARQLLRRWQGLVKAAWLDCPNELTPDGDSFLVRPGVAVHPGAKLELPGVSKNPPRPRKLPPGFSPISLVKKPGDNFDDFDF
jgi:hypothetical protein